MTLETLLGCSASELEAFTDQELETFFAPYLDVCRPERVQLIKASSGPKKSSQQHNTLGKALAAKFLAEQMGIDFKSLNDDE